VRPHAGKHDVIHKITYRNAVTGAQSHGHRQHAQKISDGSLGLGLGFKAKIVVLGFGLGLQIPVLGIGLDALVLTVLGLSKDIFILIDCCAILTYPTRLE